MSIPLIKKLKERLEEIENGKNIETITNDNGTATKFPDGTMLCRKTVPKEELATTQVNSFEVQGITIHRSGAYNWTFPVPFIDDNVQVFTDVHNSPSNSRLHISRNNGVSRNTTQIQILSLESMIDSGVGYKNLLNVYVSAIGRWK